MDSRANTPFWADKSFWLAILTPVGLMLGKKLGLQFDVAEIAGMVAAVVSFIAASKWKSGQITVAEIKAGAAAAAPVGAPADPAAAIKDAAKP